MRKRTDSEHPCQGSICKISKKPALLRPPFILCEPCAGADILARLAEVGYEASFGGEPKEIRKEIMGQIGALRGT